jgi:hypothetical protein
MRAHEPLSPPSVSLSIITSVTWVLAQFCAQVGDLSILTTSRLAVTLTRGQIACGVSKNLSKLASSLSIARIEALGDLQRENRFDRRGDLHAGDTSYLALEGEHHGSGLISRMSHSRIQNEN